LRSYPAGWPAPKPPIIVMVNAFGRAESSLRRSGGHRRLSRLSGRSIALTRDDQLDSSTNVAPRGNRTGCCRWPISSKAQNVLVARGQRHQFGRSWNHLLQRLGMTDFSLHQAVQEAVDAVVSPPAPNFAPSHGRADALMDGLESETASFQSARRCEATCRSPNDCPCDWKQELAMCLGAA